MATTPSALNMDTQLARASAAGDHHAFETLYHRHHQRVYSLCLRMLQNPEEAEDLTQDVFLHVYRRIGTFRGTSAFTTWLHRLTINTILMYMRRRQRWRAELSLDAGDLGALGEKNAPWPGRELRIEPIDLERAINRLPVGYRVVFVLHDIEGYEHAEISRLLGVKIGTSKSQLHKARLQLRRMLTYKVGDDPGRSTS